MKDIIQKAVDRGFSFKDIDGDMLNEYKFLDDTCGFVTIESGSVTVAFSMEEIIFSHSFLKAFFGEKREVKNYKEIADGESWCDITIDEYELRKDEQNEYLYFKPNYIYKGWQYHAQQLVLTEDRIEYLRRYLTKG